MAWIDDLLTRMLTAGASDLHLTSGRKPMLRIDGDMTVVDSSDDIAAERMEQVLLEIAPEENRAQFQSDGDTDFAYELPGRARFRVNLFRDHRGPGAVLRVIPSKILTAADLKLPQTVIDFCLLSKGLVVVTGPTGSGKSTTLAAMVDHINKTRADHILTIEDPIEFVHGDQRCLVNQREVGRHTQGFKRALRAALREDPDIVLVGEMRDLETIEIAIETAETGHLVFGTLHTTTAISTVDRIIDQFPADRQNQIRTMLSSSLKGVVAQTLCKKKPKGRVAALEILVSTSAIAAQIREGKTHHIASAMQTGGRLGMRLMNDSLFELVKSGQVEPLEAYIKAVDKEALRQAFQGAGIPLDLSAVPEAATPTPSMGTAGTASLAGQAPLSRSAPEPAPRAPLPSSRPVADAPPLSASSPAGGVAGAVGHDPFEEFKRKRR